MGSGADSLSLSSLQESNSTKCVCESWPEKPFTGFMEGMKDLVERIQSAD